MNSTTSGRNRVMKLLAGAVVTLTIWFITGITAAIADPIVSISPANVSKVQGDVFTLDITIADVSDLFAFQFDIGFAPDILGAINITEGSFLPTGGATFFLAGVIDNVTGVITATAD